MYRIYKYSRWKYVSRSKSLSCTEPTHVQIENRYVSLSKPGCILYRIIKIFKLKQGSRSKPVHCTHYTNNQIMFLDQSQKTVENLQKLRLKLRFSIKVSRNYTTKNLQIFEFKKRLLLDQSQCTRQSLQIFVLKILFSIKSKPVHRTPCKIYKYSKWKCFFRSKLGHNKEATNIRIDNIFCLSKPSQRTEYSN